ncbi:spermine oxidase-like [Penaeus indicus]|uniref:spermine oxidase-like n=1 Tax=Penaeus indicus TaxID=29960 RepID=UPI00300D8C40
MACIPQHVRVCIIGAGVAGLSAAQKLIQAGVKDIVVLEAQDRIGGRVHTIEHGDHVLEFGAHWIHGEEGNVVYEWASQNNLVDDEPTLKQTGIGETVFVRENGEVVPPEMIEAFEMAFANLEEQGEKDFPSYPNSVGQYYKEQFKSLNQWGGIGEELLNWRGNFQNCIDGTDSWYDCSAKGHTCYKECPGNIVVNWKNGYRALLNHLKEPLPKSCLHLNSAVKTIDWHGSLATSTSCNLTLWSGQVIRADHVVFTPSLAVLKAVAEEMFNPPLPMEKSRAIEGLGIGVVDKIFIQFPQQWWETGCDGFSFLYDQETPETITKENWEYGILGFYEVFRQPNMLCGWITGPAARMMEQVHEEEVIKRCVSFLRKRLASKFQIPDALWGTRSTWGQNPWVKGSYSFRSIKSEAMNVWAADLASPLMNAKDVPVVCFAGEATHDYFYSTVHGAVETGRREAERLIQYFSRSQGIQEPVLSAATSSQRKDISSTVQNSVTENSSQSGEIDRAVKADPSSRL